ncbi:membrane protein insertion efficiency factor YidD [Terriglobus aquaticus]|uniref:Putative membrane protein insertion efficiency factor n=1 Tax=Terriglobus aquaticus TaxID=940139 RepID=A0ABW9KI95_9BACT|nr:membrane protein insertion efficiency factor YidD [Terriglobus aquaticus]
MFRALFWVYRHTLSPLLHGFGVGGCRFQPSCSEYAEVAIARFGPWRGGWLALRRLGRCHPFSKGGLDQVPTADRS